MITFEYIARKYLESIGFEPYECETEQEARSKVDELAPKGKWPCYFFKSDTTGEKDFEEFTSDSDILDLGTFEGIGIIKNKPLFNGHLLEKFLCDINRMLDTGIWTKRELVMLFRELVPEFVHKEMNKSLDSRM
jgi:hypothetical protein